MHDRFNPSWRRFEFQARWKTRSELDNYSRLESDKMLHFCIEKTKILKKKKFCFKKMNYFGILMILNHIYNGLWDVLTPKLWTQCQRSESTNSSLSVLHFFNHLLTPRAAPIRRKCAGNLNVIAMGEVEFEQKWHRL